MHNVNFGFSHTKLYESKISSNRPKPSTQRVKNKPWCKQPHAWPFQVQTNITQIHLIYSCSHIRSNQLTCWKCLSPVPPKEPFHWCYFIFILGMASDWLPITGDPREIPIQLWLRGILVSTQMASSILWYRTRVFNTRLAMNVSLLTGLWLPDGLGVTHEPTFEGGNGIV